MLPPLPLLLPPLLPLPLPPLLRVCCAAPIHVRPPLLPWYGCCLLTATLRATWHTPVAPQCSISPKKSAGLVRKVLLSARANATNNLGLDESRLRVGERPLLRCAAFAVRFCL